MKEKKGAAKGKEEDKKPKRKGPPAAALKAMLEAQAAEEEARKQAEEEQRKKEVQLVLTITSRILRILMEHIEMKNSLDSKLHIVCICSVRNLNTPEVIIKILSKNLSIIFNEK